MTWHPDMPIEYRNQIVTGDARELARAIPDESVDLIFTDPVYDRIDDYRWLAETAARVLKPWGMYLAFCDIANVGRAISASEAIFYLWQFIMVRPNGYPIGDTSNGTLFCKYTPALLFGREEKRRAYKTVWDIDMPGNHWGNKFNWSKNGPTVYRWIEALSPNHKYGSIIFDPFAGSGTVPAVCKMLQRNYIAFEIDPETADMARDRVANTQPPLPLVMPVQGELL